MSCNTRMWLLLLQQKIHITQLSCTPVNTAWQVVHVEYFQMTAWLICQGGAVTAEQEMTWNNVWSFSSTCTV